MKITVYKKISDSHIVRDITSGQTVAHALPDIDFNNAVIIVNGTKAVPSYKLKDGDTVLIRLTPSDSAESFWYAAWAIFEPISYNIYSGVQAYKARKAAQDAQDELEKLKNQTNASNIDNRPFLAGATNTVATDKSQPYICGRHLFTPYLLGSPFYVIDGTDGADQYVMEALECGFNSQILQKVNVDDVTVKTFSDTTPQEGAYDFNSDSIFYTGGKIEVAQDGKEFDTLTNLNNKVVSKSCNTQIPYDSKVASGDDSYLTYTLDKHAKDVTVAISFPYGLYAYNDSSDKTETTVEIVPEYSLDGGKTYTEFTFNQKTVYDSTKVIQEEWKYRTSDFNDATAHKNAFANKDISGFSLYQVTVLSSEHADEYNSITELRNGGYVVTGNIIKHASYESVYSNTFTRNVQKEIRFTAHHDFTLADYTTLQSTADKVILIRLRNKGTDDSKIKNQAYVLFYQSVCFDPNKSSTPAGILDDSGTAGLVSCKLIEDRERAYCTILGIKCKATKNNEDKLKKINVITHGVARTWDGTTWSPAKTATRNPAAWLLEVMTSSTHPLSKFDDSELDRDSFGDAYDYCANHKNSAGAVDPLYFDYVVSGSATKEDLLSKICDVFGGMLYRNIYGKYAVAIDCSKSNAIAAFSSQNVISVENKKTFSRRTDGLRIKYINSANDVYKEDTYLVMREVNGIAETISADSVIRDVTVNGITTYDHVVWYARRLMAIESLRPKTTTVEVGEEGIYYTPMSKILLQDDSLKIGISDGVIKTVYIDSNGTVTGAALKNPVTFEDGKTYGMIVNHITDTGAVPLSVVVTGNGTTNVVSFTTVYSTSSANYPTSGDTFSFGLLDGDSFGKITTPYIISSISKTDTGYSLECVNYNEAIYDTGKIPDYVSNITYRTESSDNEIPAESVSLVQGPKGDKGDKGDTGAQGIQGPAGAAGTDATAITISDPDSTTPESGMTYDNTYYGMYNGVWYKWSWSSTTTGVWSQVSAEYPTNIAVRYSFDEIPDLPDDSGAIYKADYGEFTSTAYWSAYNGVISLSNGFIVNTVTSTAHNTIFNKSVSIASKLVKIQFKTSVDEFNASLYYNNGSLTVLKTLSSIKAGTIYTIVVLVPTDAAYTNLILNINGSTSGSTVTILDFYIGDGTTTQPIIDNISGSVNATGSGVVSVPGVSGKACQFVGLKAIQLDLSKYADVQSWWLGGWFNISAIPSALNYLFMGTGSYYKDFIRLGTDGNLSFVTRTPSGDMGVSVSYSGLLNSLHFVCGSTVVTSASSFTKKLYLDGVLVATQTFSRNATACTPLGICYIGGSGLTSGVMSGYQDDFCFGAGTITDAQVLGLYLDRGAHSKLYTLADYNYDSQVSSWEIVSSVPSFTRARSGTVTPSSVTFSAKAIIASAAQDYSGRFIIYTSTNGTTFSSVYTSSADESSHTYSPASGISAIRIELYKSGGTSVLVATKEFAVPYAADVAPEYLGIGVLTDTSTKAFTGATVADDGTITAGSTVSNIITGDWMVGYVTSTMVATVYYWNGTAWTATTDQKYVSPAAFDIMNLTTGGYTVANYTIIMNAIIKNLMVSQLKLLTGGKLYAGTGTYNNADTPIFLGYDTDGVAKFSLGTGLSYNPTDGLSIAAKGTFSGALSAAKGTFSGLLAQGCNFYIAAKIIISGDGSTWKISSDNSKYSTFRRLNTGIFVIPIPSDDRAYGIPRVICHYCSDTHTTSSAAPTLDNVANNTYHPGLSNPVYQCNARSGLNVFTYDYDGTSHEWMPIYFTDNNSDGFLDPAYALLTLIYI